MCSKKPKAAPAAPPPPPPSPPQLRSPDEEMKDEGVNARRQGNARNSLRVGSQGNRSYGGNRIKVGASKSNVSSVQSNAGPSRAVSAIVSALAG